MGQDQKAHNDKTYILHSLKKVLDEKRYSHTIGVASTAVSLAMRYEVDLEKAEIAGLLHDCAKYGTDQWKMEKCKKYKVTLSIAEQKNPALIHAKLGAAFAKKKYEISDEEILSAIRKHTTGSADMTMLEKIIYVADYIEPGRKMLERLTEIRKLAFLDIDEAIYMIAGDTLKYLAKKDIVVDETTKITYEYYKAIHDKK